MINKRIFFPIVFGVLFSVEVMSQNLISGREVLEGVERVHVEINNHTFLPRGPITDGLSEMFNYHLKNDVELILRRNGIKLSSSTLEATLSIQVTTVNHKNAGKPPIYTAVIDVELRENVQLPDTLLFDSRNPSKEVHRAVTWPPRGLLASGKVVLGRGDSLSDQNKFVQDVRQKVGFWIGIFCQEYLAVNPVRR